MLVILQSLVLVFFTLQVGLVGLVVNIYRLRKIHDNYEEDVKLVHCIVSDNSDKAKLPLMSKKSTPLIY